MVIFFESFPSFRGRGLHLMGESYAVRRFDLLHNDLFQLLLILQGRSLPVYAATIYDQNAKLIEEGIVPINLQSIAIGNGITDYFASVKKPFCSLAYLIWLKCSVLRSHYIIQCSLIDGLNDPIQSSRWAIPSSMRVNIDLSDLSLPVFACAWRRQ